MNNDVISIVISLLDIDDVIKCSTINGRFNAIVNREYMWYHLCNRDYGEHYENLKRDTLFETYRFCFDLDKIRSKFRLAMDMDTLFKSQQIQSYNNKINEIPKGICQLVNLQGLDLSFNCIKEIPKEIGQLINLQWLYLSGNQIKEIPKEICQLVNLIYVGLANNQITKIPIEICRLVKLFEFTLYDNPIRKIPDELKGLPIQIEGIYRFTDYAFLRFRF